jgi:hypothetical protein
MSVRGLLLVVVGLSVWSCSSTTRECNVGADCASGACRSDGTCVPAPAKDGGVPLTDASVDRDAQTTADSPAGETTPPSDGASCMPNNDDIVTRDEVYFAAGLHATYRVALSTPIDTAGTVQTDGSRQWDFSGAGTGHHGVLDYTLDADIGW